MKLSFQEKGKGVPLVLLHGFPFDHTIWETVCAELSNKFRVITPDMRGAGMSSVTSQEFNIRDMASDVVELLDRLSIAAAYVAGHSMGGYVALALARMHSERVLGLALVASHVYADTPEKRDDRLALIEKIRHSSPVEMLAMMPNSLSRDKKVQVRCMAYIDRADTNGVIGSLHAMAGRPSQEAFWQGGEMPKVVIAGVNDQLIPIETGITIAKQGKNCRLYKIENSGHMPMLEQPTALAAALDDWISSLR